MKACGIMRKIFCAVTADTGAGKEKGAVEYRSFFGCISYIKFPVSGQTAFEVKQMDTNDLPLGFAFVLAQRPEAMQVFSGLSEERKAELLQRAHGVSSKAEMQALVEGLSAQG